MARGFEYQPDDLRELQLLLGEDAMPPEVEQEYDLWRRLYHRRASGRLPLEALVTICRLANRNAPQAAAPKLEPPTRTWSTADIGCPVLFDGQPGEFMGFTNDHLLSVRLDNRQNPQGCSPKAVTERPGTNWRLVTTGTELTVLDPERDTQFQAKLLERRTDGTLVVNPEQPGCNRLDVAPWNCALFTEKLDKPAKKRERKPELANA